VTSPKPDRRIIATPNPRAGHNLPNPMPAANDWLPPNTVAYCDHCDRVFVVRVSADDFVTYVWTRLRWYHRTAHRLLRGHQ
jgi:hypothetical protein